MAATGFTPVSLYYSATASNVPLAANLVAGELAMNTNDGKLFFKDSSGVVQTMASKGTGSIGGSTTQVQFNNAGALGGSASLTWNGTVLTSSGFSGPHNGTVGATTPATGAFTTLSATGADAAAVFRAIATTGRLVVYPYNSAGTGVVINSMNTAESAYQAMTIQASALGIFANTAVTGTLSSSADATIYGLTVGRGAGAISTNTAVGASALAANTTGVQQTAIGASAGASITTNSYLSAVGYQAAYYMTDTNDAFGRQALYGQSGATGYYNVGVGFRSGYSMTSGNLNTAIGAFALLSNTTASNNTAVGYQAAYTNQTGAQNTDVGMKAGYLGLARIYTTSIGYFAGYSSNGTSNTYMGYASGPNNGTTSVENYNTGIGAQALNGITTGSNNTAVGYQAGYSNTTGATNVFVGYQSGNIATGTQNTFIGPYSGNTMTTGSKNVIIGGWNGSSGGLDIRSSSNYIALSDGDGNLRQIINSAGGTQFNAGISVGGTGPASEGSGVKFPATQIASADANTLDDYEEGTWTPTISAGVTTPSYTVNSGRYVKVGVLVYINLYIQFNSVQTLNGSQLEISGLPFSAIAPSGGNPGGPAITNCGSAFNSSATQPLPIIYPNGTKLTFTKVNGTAFFGTDISAGNFNITIAGCYYAA
jgi:hypothetical protein